MKPCRLGLCVVGAAVAAVAAAAAVAAKVSGGRCDGGFRLERHADEWRQFSPIGLGDLMGFVFWAVPLRAFECRGGVRCGG